MTAQDRSTDHDHDHHDDGEHPILELFNAEDIVEDPGEPDEEQEEVDTTSDTDFPSP